MPENPSSPRSISSTLEVVSTLTHTQQQVLQALAESPRALRVDDLGKQLNLHGNTIRGVLSTLLDLDLVGREAEQTEKRGRPSWLYAAKASADTQVVMESYAQLISALADELARTSADPVASAYELGSAWGARVLADQEISGPVLRESSGDCAFHMAKLRILLSRLGFQASASTRKNTIELHQCPLLARRDAGGDVPLVCQIHNGMLNRMAKEISASHLQAHVIPNAGPGYCDVVLKAT